MRASAPRACPLPLFSSMVSPVAQSLPRKGEHFKAAFGARVLVLFDDGNRYWGTINNRASSMEDRRHPDGPWSVLFDDCTQERFRDGDKDCKGNPYRSRIYFFLKHPISVFFVGNLYWSTDPFCCKVGIIGRDENQESQKV